jgi:putative two-component system response regulator
MRSMETAPESAGRLLIVGAEPTNLALLAEVLSPQYQVQIATQGERALALAVADDPPDLVLLDVAMPEMDGYEVCQRLKADAATQAIPVIFVTSLDDHADEEKGLELGAVDYITKPFKPSVVLTRVKVHVALAQHRRILELLLARTARVLALSEAELEALHRLERLNH